MEGTQTNASCTDAPVFGYPVSMLEYLYYQQFLSATMNGDDDADFEPCGTHATDPIPTCATDWDGDGVADADEPLPENLFQQILVQQCTLNGGVPASEPYSTEWMDVDERDEDTLFSRDLTHNTGGRSGPDDEEAYADVVLRGGQEYLIVVGGNGGTGTYELSVREIE